MKSDSEIREVLYIQHVFVELRGAEFSVVTWR